MAPRAVRVLVLDTGAPEGEPGRSFVATEPDVADHNGHGTAVAGLVRREAPGARVVCWKAVPASGHGSATELAMALFAAAGADPPYDVVNISLATSRGEPRLRRAIRALAAAGSRIVCGAGNDPSAIGYPARYPECVSVGAIDGRGRRRRYSPAGCDVAVVVGPRVRVRGLRGGWTYADGTSVACAIHAGRVAASLVASNP